MKLDALIVRQYQVRRPGSISMCAEVCCCASLRNAGPEACRDSHRLIVILIVSRGVVRQSFGCSWRASVPLIAHRCIPAPCAVRLRLQLIRCFAGQSKTTLSTAMSNLRASGGGIDAEAFSSREECLGKSAAGCCVVGMKELLGRGVWQVCCKTGFQTPVIDPLSLPLLCFNGHRQAT